MSEQLSTEEDGQSPAMSKRKLSTFPCANQELLADLMTPDAGCMYETRENSHQRTMYPPYFDLALARIKTSGDLLLIAKCRTITGSATPASHALTAPPPSPQVLLLAA